MKEDEAKKKKCPHLLIQHSIALLTANITSCCGSVISEKMKGVHRMKLSSCLGSGCMMWEFEIKRETDDVTTDDEVKTVEQAKKYVRAGWVYNGFMHARTENGGQATIRMFRDIESDSGDCGLKTKELYCEGCNH